MKCKYCQKELKEGMLYCEGCGKPVQMVPNFEPEIEARMDETLAAIAVDDVIHGVDETTVKKGFPKVVFVVAAVFAIAAAFGVFVMVSINTSYGTYYKKGMRAFNEGKYGQALSYFNKALEKHAGSVEVQLQTARSYQGLGEEESALDEYLKIIDTVPDCRDAYVGAISLYEKTGDYTSINRLIGACRNDDIYEEFSHYLAFPPEFSAEEGTYHERLKIRLKAEQKGTIYYTLDGSEPGTDSYKYSAPITLNPGNNVVRAVFANEKGILSESISKIYEVELPKPEEPVVTPIDGNYHLPELITVTVPDECEVFYTTDGTEPTNHSERYEGPLPMPLNGSRFKFVAYSKNNKIYSSVVTAVYHLDFNGACTSQVAANYVAATLAVGGKILDADGNVPELNGQYKYRCGLAAGKGENYYYLVEEYFLPKGGEMEKTGQIYGVNAFDFTICTVNRDSEGNLVFQSL